MIEMILDEFVKFKINKKKETLHLIEKDIFKDVDEEIEIFGEKEISDFLINCFKIY